MSKNAADLKRRSQALSTNNRGFISRPRFGEVRENLNDEDDEDVRLETYRVGAKISAYKSIAQKSSKGLKIVEILEESPNGYTITASAPPEKDRAVKYYSFQLRTYTVSAHPEEYGLIHYSLGKVFFKDHPVGQVNYDLRAKSIENALHHFRLAGEIFDYDSHPFLFGVINTFIGQLFRERATLISSRSLLSKRGVTVNDCCQIALAALFEAQSAFLGSKLHDLEYCLANLETGWVYVLQLTEAMHEEGRGGEEKEMIILREQAILALERAQSLCDELPNKQVGSKPRTWDPIQQETHPEYIRALLSDQSISYVGGMVSYLHGRLYQDWSDELEHQEEAFAAYSRAVKPARLPTDTEQWVDAHHRAAAIAVKFPRVVDPQFGESPDTDTDLCYVSAVQHLTTALKNTSMMPAKRMDLLFHLAQANIARLNMIIDRVPEGKSLVKALTHSDGLTIMREVEANLVQAMRGSTAANTQSTQDAFVYYFACLKLSEFRMLQAAAEAGLAESQRSALLEDAISQLVNALLSRSMIDNLDLHYVGTAQMAQMLLSAHRDDSSAKWFGRALLVCSAIGNRVQGAPIELRADSQIKFWDEGVRVGSLAILAASRQAQWQCHHLGPVLLTEAPTSGYAYWKMEMNLDPNEIPPPEEVVVVQRTYAQAKAARAPPSSTMPHMTDGEKTYLLQKTLLRTKGLLGEAVAGGGDPTVESAGKTYAEQMREEAGMNGAPSARPGELREVTPSAPVGSVPLWALGQNPDFSNIDRLAEENRERAAAAAKAIQDAADAAEKKKKKWFGSGAKSSSSDEGVLTGDAARVSPYAGRRRHVVPMMYLLASGVKDIVGEGTDRAVFLMPQPGAKGGNRVQFKVVGDDIESWMKKAEEREKKERPKGILGGFLSLFGRKNKSNATDSAAKGKLRDVPRTAEVLFNPNREPVPNQVPMWATQQCYFAFCTLSRLHRHQLVLRGNNLRLSRSERTNYTLNDGPVELASKYRNLLQALDVASRRTPIPPISLRELSQRSFSDLQSVFQSHVALCRANTELEVFLFRELARRDDYIPMVTCCPSLSRDISSYDPTLFDATALVCNLQEDNLLNVNSSNNAEAEAEKEAMKKQIKKGKNSKAIEKKAKEVLSGKKSKNPGDLLNEIEGLNRIRYGLGQSMDGSGTKGGSRAMIAEHLGDKECMLLWHHPNAAKQKIHVILMWREDSKSKRPAYNLDVAKNGADKDQETRESKTRKDQAKSKLPKKGEKGYVEGANHNPLKPPCHKGIVMEMCKSEVDAAQLGFLIKNYLDALHSFPASHRTSYCTKALRSLSCYLAFSEVLLMIPTFIDTLVICAPPLMRMIPWHLLLVEYENPLHAHKAFAGKDIVAKGKIASATAAFSIEANLLDPDKSHHAKNPTIEEHLMERYLVRIGPTLPLYELCENAAAKRLEEPGMHRMCAVDGESLQLRGPRLRSSQLEVACIKAIFSGDPDDCFVMQYDAAAPKQVTTSKYYHVSRADREKAKLAKDIKRRQREIEKRKKQASKTVSRNKRGKAYDSSSDEEDDVPSSESDESSASSGDETAVTARRWLNDARIVHCAANRVPMTNEAALKESGGSTTGLPKDKQQAPNVTKFASIALPQYFNSKGNATSDTRTQLNAADLVAQVHFRNCGLLVLSRFGIADGTKAPKAPNATGYGKDADKVSAAATNATCTQSPFCEAKVVDANCEFIEAAHCAGATTILHPMWGTFEQGGLSTLSTLVFLVRFYSELPIHSRKRHSISHAVRNTQLWMRDQTAEQVISWLGQCPLPEKERNELIVELELYVKVSDPIPDTPIHHKVASANDGSPFKEVVRPERKKFFSHWLQWGAFSVSGHGGGIHPIDLTEENEDVHNDHLIYDETLNDINMEIMILKEEGRYADAAVLEQRVIQLKKDATLEKIRQVKKSAVLAARAVGDMLEAVDRALLDQDDDEIEIGDREEDELQFMKEKEQHKKDIANLTGEHQSEREIAEAQKKKAENKIKRAEERASHEAALSRASYRKEVGPLTPGGGSKFLANLTGKNPQIEKLATQQTPISRFRGYVESFFPLQVDDDYELDEDGVPGSPQLKIKPKKFVPIEPGSAKMQALELQQKNSLRRVGIDEDEAAEDEKDLYYEDEINEKNVGEYNRTLGQKRGQRERRFKTDKTPAELEADLRALERKNERDLMMKGSSANLLDLLPENNSNGCRIA